MSANRRIIKSDQNPLASLWDLPIFGENGEVIEASELPALTMPTAEDIEQIQKQAYDEAYKTAYDKAFQEGLAKGAEAGEKKGYEEGLEKGRVEGLAQGDAIIKQKVEQLEAILSTFAKPLAKLDQAVEDQLVTLTTIMAKQLIRRELRTDPGQIIGTLRNTVAILPIAARDVRVLLHPQDAALVRESMAVNENTSEEERRWRIVEDPALTRGGCILETEYSRIDATVESRLAAVIAQTLGGEREGDKA